MADLEGIFLKLLPWLVLETCLRCKPKKKKKKAENQKYQMHTPVIQSLVKFVWWFKTFKNLWEIMAYNCCRLQQINEKKKKKIKTKLNSNLKELTSNINSLSVSSSFRKSFIPGWTQRSCSWDLKKGCPCVPWPAVGWCRAGAWNLVYWSQSLSNTVWWGLSAVWTTVGTAWCSEGHRNADKNLIKFVLVQNKDYVWHVVSLGTQHNQLHNCAWND